MSVVVTTTHMSLLGFESTVHINLLSSRCGFHVLSAGRTRHDPEGVQRVWIWIWSPSWESRPSKTGALAVGRRCQPEGRPKTGNLGWGRRSQMMAGHMEA